MSDVSFSDPDNKFSRYLFEYRHDNADWGIEIVARSPAEARDRIKALTWARYKGEVVAKLSVPRANWLGRLSAALFKR